MTTGYVLILAVLILGGVIATLGDRIGMRIGKARLSLFNLRPRQTATLISIVTGSIISASTLALLFGVSRQLRTGVFELEQIQSDLSQARTNLANTRDERDRIEDALAAARKQQEEAQTELQSINRFLNQAVARQRLTQDQLQQSQSELDQSQAQLQNLRSQLGSVSQQATQLQQEIQRLEAERTALLRQQETVREQIIERDQTIARRDREIARREQRLSQLQAQQAILQEDIADLERQFEGLFRGNVAVARNETLAAGLIQVVDRQDARRAVDRLLRQANRETIRQIAPGTELDQQVLLVPQDDVSRLIERISDRQPYVVRILSAANYIIGEPCVVAEADPCVQVFIDALVNELVYEEDERIATVTLDPRNLTNQDLVEKLNLLVASLQFRARQDGIVGESLQIADGRTEVLLAFLAEVKAINQPLEIQAIASNNIFSVGPLQVDLIAVNDGKTLARTDQLPQNPLPEVDTGETESEL